MELIMHNIFRSLTLFSLILFASQSISASVKEAVIASKSNNAIKAAKLWSQLANKGNSIAQYNIAKHYSSGKGVQKNKVIAEQWLKDATRSGLITAYLNLNKRAIAPANGKTISFQVGPVAWLSKQSPKKYTIQLASSRNEKSIKNSYEKII